MSTYSQYKIQLIGTGEEAGQWGDITNNNFGSATPGTYRGFEQAIGGRADVTMSSTTITLSLTDSNDSQDARALYLNLSGTPGEAADLIVPALQKSYLVKNGTTGGFAVTIKVTGQTGVSIPNGKTVWVYNNGTDVVTSLDYIPSLTLGSALPVASGGTGITAFGTGVATALGQNVTGSGGIALASSPAFTTPNIGAATGTQLNLTAQGDVRFEDASGGQYAAIQAPATIATNYTLTLPTTDGDANQVLTTDGSGVLSWTTPTSGITTGKAIAMAIVFGG